MRYLFIIYFFTAFALFSQTQNDLIKNYVPITSSGLLPDELKSTPAEKSTVLLSKINSDDKSEKKLLEEYFINNTYDEDRLLKSGYVLFNTTVNYYLNKIADHLLAGNPELRNQIKIYPIRINAANAWAYDNGHIYITLDYIARYNTEAQLAMVLCHEFAHFINKHTLERYRNRSLIIKKMNSTYHADTLWKRERDFYKNQESQADLQGFEFLKKSGYNLKDIPDKFDLMLLSDYSFENSNFATDFFNEGFLKINPKVFYKEIKPIHIDDKYDDTWDTHPNIYKRKKAIIEHMNSFPEKKGQDFIVGETDFFTIRDICRFETILADVRDFDMPSAIYHSVCMLKKYPQNEFLHKTIANCLYKMAALKSYSRLFIGHYDYLQSKDGVKSNANRDSTMGHIAQTKKFCSRLNGEDFVLLAINYNYKLYKNSQFMNPEYKTSLDSLFSILHNVHNFNYRDFYKSEEEYNHRTIYVSDTTTKNRNFVDAIDRKPAFIHLMKDKEFRSFFKDTSTVNEFEIKYISKGKTKTTYNDPNSKKLTLSKKLYFNKTEIMKMNSLLILNPMFDKNVYKKYEIEEYPQEAEQNAAYFKEKLCSELKDINLSFTLLNNQVYENNQFDKLNNIGFMNYIIDENSEYFSFPSVSTKNTFINKNYSIGYGSNYVLQVYLSEDIYDNVKIYVDGWPIIKDIKTITYNFNIVNLETGVSVYRHAFEANRKVNENEMNLLINEEINNIYHLKTSN